jgi:hypothetical protein
MERDGCDVVFDLLQNFHFGIRAAFEYTPVYLVRTR